MVRNKEKFKQAVEFRKRGFTYSEIAKICDLSKGTVSNWLSKKSFSKKVAKHNSLKAIRDNKKRLSLINKAKKAEREVRYKEAVRSADTEYRHYQSSPLFIAGLAVYQSAGDLTSHSNIRLTSNRADIHRTFIRFAEEYLGVEKKKIHFWLLLIGEASLERSVRFWTRQTGLSLAQFGKTQFVNPKSKSLHKGTGNTIIGSTVLKLKLNRWIELATKELIK